VQSGHRVGGKTLAHGRARVGGEHSKRRPGESHGAEAKMRIFEDC
jgi:hypothetical protein